MFGQTKHNISATFIESTKSINIKQHTRFYPENLSRIDTLVFNDWNNAYAYKNSPLGKRFSDEFVSSFLLAKKDDLGKTNIHKFEVNGQDVTKNLTQDFDIIYLPNQFNSSQPLDIYIEYTLTLPNSKFSGYGISKNGDRKSVV